MNSKEINEIKKCFSKTKCRIERLRACYVNEEKEKISVFHDMFLQLEEREQGKYCELFRRALSGRFGRNLYNVAFKAEEESEGGRQAQLYQLRNTALKNDELVDAYFDKLIASYIYPGKYLILAAYGVYDVPVKTKDNMQLDDSEEVYTFVLTVICPVELLREGLCYDAATNSFLNRTNDWGVKNPEAAILFPAFNMRSTDIHEALFYSKSAEERHEELVQDILGRTLGRSEKTQREVFREVIESTLSGSCTFENVRSITEAVNTMIAEKKDDPDPVTLGKREVRVLLENNGADEEKIRTFERVYDEAMGEDNTPLNAENLQDTKQLTVRSTTMKLNVKSESMETLETRVIDGREYLLIPIADDIEVNGIRIRQTKD